MGFDFSEEEIVSMYKMYQDILDEIQKETKSVAEELTNHAEKLKYEPVVNLSVEAVKYYNEELKQAEVRAMNEWKDGDLSFTNIMEKMSAGEKAKNRSKQLENQIEHEVQSWQPIDSSSIKSIDTTNWKCEVSDFEAIVQSIKRFVESLKAKQKQYASKIETQKTDNEIYISIEPVVLRSISIVIVGFETGIHESFSELEREFARRSIEVRSLGTIAAQSAVAKSLDFVSSGAAALKAKVKQILD
jgi:hypothetical protein